MLTSIQNMLWLHQLDWSYPSHKMKKREEAINTTIGKRDPFLQLIWSVLKSQVAARSQEISATAHLKYNRCFRREDVDSTKGLFLAVPINYVMPFIWLSLFELHTRWIHLLQSTADRINKVATHASMSGPLATLGCIAILLSCSMAMNYHVRFHILSSQLIMIYHC